VGECDLGKKPREMLIPILSAVAAYLFGSIPNGFLIGLARGVDLRKEGSGNIGATNALRVLGRKWGYTVFAADCLKGMLAVWSSFFIACLLGSPGQEVTAGIAAAAFAVVGHSFPVWLGFKGGKGIATSAGVMIALYPPWVFLFGLTLWLVLFFATRYVSIASIAAAISLPTSSGVLAWFGRCDWRLVVVAGLMCLLALWRHRPNIERLLAGTEKRFERKPKAAE
jgi:acyl phosphate:glycerol-3-phosphate acyltransferase